jgi:hypothetical protein
MLCLTISSFIWSTNFPEQCKARNKEKDEIKLDEDQKSCDISKNRVIKLGDRA